MKRYLGLYLKGFARGLLLLAVFVSFYLIYPKGQQPTDSEGLTGAETASWLLSVVITLLILRRTKAPSFWVLPTFLFGPLMFPFLFGYLEVEKDKKPLLTG